MIKCPKCKRQYLHDYVLARLVETTPSEKIRRAHCNYCQKS